MNLEVVKQYFYPITILDIGANTGGWYTEAARCFPGSNIFSIEANPECEEKLKGTNPEYLICLLAKDNEMYDFYTTKNAKGATGDSMYKELTYNYADENLVVIKRQGHKLDGLFEKGSAFDLIKMDVQGAELDIIKGGLNIFRASKGAILEVALKEFNQNAPLYDEVVEYMNSINFRLAETLEDLYHLGEIYHKDLFFVNENIIRN